MPELGILNGGRMGIGFNLRSLGHLSALWQRAGGGGRGFRYLTHPEGEVCDYFRSRLLIELRQQRGLQKNQLLQPYGVPDNEVQLFEPEVCRPGVRSDRLPDHVAPLLLKTHFE